MNCRRKYFLKLYPLHTRWPFFIVIGFVMLTLVSGCSHYVSVGYDELMQTNFVELSLVSGRKISGTIVKAEPHQIILQQKNREINPINKTSIRSIRRKPPVYDEFGRGVSEEEITNQKRNRNAVVYGLGGGVIGFGGSFFLSSTVAHSSESGGVIVPASTLGGGGIMTYLFVRAGKIKDRQEAIERVCEIRRDDRINGLKRDEKSPQEVLKELEEEKIRQETLRKQREKILKTLEEK